MALGSRTLVLSTVVTILAMCQPARGQLVSLGTLTDSDFGNAFGVASAAAGGGLGSVSGSAAATIGAAGLVAQAAATTPASSLLLALGVPPQTVAAVANPLASGLTGASTSSVTGLLSPVTWVNLVNGNGLEGLPAPDSAESAAATFNQLLSGAVGEVTAGIIQALFFAPQGSEQLLSSVVQGLPSVANASPAQLAQFQERLLRGLLVQQRQLSGLLGRLVKRGAKAETDYKKETEKACVDWATSKFLRAFADLLLALGQPYGNVYDYLSQLVGIVFSGQSVTGQQYLDAFCCDLLKKSGIDFTIASINLIFGDEVINLGEVTKLLTEKNFTAVEENPAPPSPAPPSPAPPSPQPIIPTPVTSSVEASVNTSAATATAAVTTTTVKAAAAAGTNTIAAETEEEEEEGEEFEGEDFFEGEEIEGEEFFEGEEIEGEEVEGEEEDSEELALSGRRLNADEDEDASESAFDAAEFSSISDPEFDLADEPPAGDADAVDDDAVALDAEGDLRTGGAGSAASAVLKALQAQQKALEKEKKAAAKAEKKEAKTKPGFFLFAGRRRPPPPAPPSPAPPKPPSPKPKPPKKKGNKDNKDKSPLEDLPPQLIEILALLQGKPGTCNVIEWLVFALKNDKQLLLKALRLFKTLQNLAKGLLAAGIRVANSKGTEAAGKIVAAQSKYNQQVLGAITAVLTP
ncbi:hypothetical protein GPECTOR_197g340 [Gonium pectorale]|uniref:MI domain-containing protein n=1 Tax=Gonium pectorale TaxID=33097 RepID=A0A150FX05_GONPE|nr:hypothetical protein GPECTOR_197g340 [Gonium pectorale]|eukprot:KXZ42136.1 hypothetical protein GPECTOR_197g340 [Gonium pectorale]